MVAGQAVRGELSLYRVRAHEGRLSDRPHGQQTVKYDVMCKMVAWFARGLPRTADERSSVLRVRTTDEMLLTALNLKDERLWRYHGDHLRRWTAERRRSLQNLADDHKAEQRPVPSFADRRTAAAVKYRNRMRSAVHEIAAQLVGYAVRREFSGIEYDDSETGFCPDFPYGALRAQIQAKCEGVGLEFRVPGPPVGPTQETADTLADLSVRGRL
jgi:hypothetical protein